MSTRYVRCEAVEAAPLQDETILYNPGIKRFCLLNSTAAFLWQRLADPMTPDELAAAMCAHFQGVDEATAKQDVRGALEELHALEAIEVKA